MREDVEFAGVGGTALRGWLYRSENARPGPAVVMAHGLSAVKEMALDRFAEVFQRGGLTVLVYDHRNFGASDGEPRQEIDPWAQTRDYRRAIEWLGQQSEVNAERVGIWGSSFSGGEVIVLGACDDRVKAVVANVPLAGLPGIDYADTGARFAALREALLDESGAEAVGAEAPAIGPCAVVREEGVELPAFLDQPESSEWFLRTGRAPGSRWENQVTLRNAFGGQPPFDPGLCVGHVAPRPLLMVVATEDRLTETAIALQAFERAGEPKQLERIEGHHFTPYDGPAFLRASGAARDFFRKHL